MKLTVGCRVKAMEAGLWQSSDGSMVRVRRMHSAHLVNALLRALADGEPRGITEPLAAEVSRRGLRDVAIAEAKRRELCHS